MAKRDYRCRLILIAAYFYLMLVGEVAFAHPVSGTIEAGLQDLAQIIANKSNQNDADVVAVLPFPNSDGTCSVLSTYLADELIQSLFSVNGSKVRIIERSQLEALLHEIKIGEGGLLNPVTTQKLGTLSGVKALVLGTVTIIGNHIRINARLISTANGQAVSAAAIGIARNGEIDGLLSQPLAGSNGLCGSTGFGRPENPADANGSAINNDLLPSQGIASSTHSGVSFSVQTVARSSDRKAISLVIALTDKLKTPVQALLVDPKPLLIDDQATLADISQANGIQNCNNNFAEAVWCEAAWPRVRWTTLSPNTPTVLLLRFSGQQALQGNHVSLAAALLLAPVSDTEDAKPGKPTLVSLSLANIVIPAGKAP